MLSTRELQYIKQGRHMARTDLKWLCQKVLNRAAPYHIFKEGVHDKMLNHLQHFDVQGEDKLDGNGYRYIPPGDPNLVLPGSRRRLLLAPRGWYKTSYNVIAHTIQWILNYPDVTILIVHASQEVAEHMIVQIKNQFQTNPVMRYFFPEFCPATNIKEWGTRQYFSCPARTVFTMAPTVSVGGIESIRTGMHYHVLKFTDIVDEKNSSTREQCKKIIYSYGMCRNLLISPSYWIDIEGTRYDFGDLYGRIVDEWIEEKPENRTYQVFTMGCYQKDLKGAAEKFTPDELGAPYYLDEEGRKVSRFPEEFSLEKLEAMRKDPVTGEQLFCCTPGWSPVLMDDWTEKRIEDVQVGDTVVGFGMEHRGLWDRTILRRSRVLAKGSLKAPVVCVVTNLGSTIYCTPDHQWYNGRELGASDGHSPYLPPKVNRRLVRVYDDLVPQTPKHSALWNHLAGLIDGEGHIRKTNACITLSQSPTANGDVCKKIESLLTELNIPWGVHNRKDQGFCKIWWLKGGRALSVKLLNYCDLGKRKQLVDQLWACNGKVSKGRDGRERIVSIEPIGEQEVFWLQTETGNYVVQGFASKNSQQLNDPLATEETQQPFPLKYLRWKTGEELKRIPMQYFITTIDTAEKVTDRSDYTCITTCGWDRAGRCYVVDVRLGKFLPEETVEHIFGVHQKYHPTKILIEETGFVRGLMPAVARMRDTLGIYPNIDFIKRDTNLGKAERILGWQPFYKNGMVYFSSDLPDFVKDQLNHQLSRFPKYQHDDLLDTLADQLQHKSFFGVTKASPTEREVMEKAQEILIYKKTGYEAVFGEEKPVSSGYDGLGAL